MNKSWLLSVVLLSSAALTATPLDDLISKHAALSEQLQESIGNPLASTADTEALMQQYQALAEEIKAEQTKKEIVVTQPAETTELPKDPKIAHRQEQQKLLHNQLEDLLNGFIPSLMQKEDLVIFEEQKLCLLTFEKAIIQALGDEQTDPKITECRINLLILCCLRQKELQAKIELLATNLIEKPLIAQQILHLQVKMLKMLCDHVRHEWPQLALGKTLAAINEQYFSHNQTNKHLLSLLPVDDLYIKYKDNKLNLRISDEICTRNEQISEQLLAHQPTTLPNRCWAIKMYFLITTKPKNLTKHQYLKISHWFDTCKKNNLLAERRRLKNDHHLQAIKLMRKLIKHVFYNFDSMLFDQYVTIIKQYRMGAYRLQDQALKNFLTDVEQMAGSFEKNRQEIEDQLATDTTLSENDKNTLSTTQIVISLFTNKLLSIKNELFVPCQEVMSDATKMGISIRFKNITSRANTKDMLAENDQIARLFDNVQKIAINFTNMSDFSPQAVYELLFIKSELQRYLKYQERSSLEKLARRPSKELTFVSEMATLLESMCLYVLQTTKDPFTKKLLGFSISEAQFSSGDAAGAAKQILIEFTEQISGKKFGNFKDAFLHILCSATPYMAGSVLSLALPLLSEQVKAPIVALFAQHQESKTPLTTEVLTQLVDKNPSILDALGSLASGLMTNKS